MTRYTDIASLILVPVALVAAVAAGACEVVAGAHDARPSKGEPIAPRSRHRDAFVCLDYCHARQMIVREWDGREPITSLNLQRGYGFTGGTARGCVCGEVSR